MKKIVDITSLFKEGINDNDVITVYYSNAWWENCLNWDSAKAKLQRDGSR